MQPSFTLRRPRLPPVATSRASSHLVQSCVHTVDEVKARVRRAAYTLRRRWQLAAPHAQQRLVRLADGGGGPLRPLQHRDAQPCRTQLCMHRTASPG